jgi:hypothetical protein
MASGGVPGTEQPRENSKLHTKERKHSLTSIEKKEVSLASYHNSSQSFFKKNFWFQAVCLLRFDIEVGSVLEQSYPPSQ